MTFDAINAKCLSVLVLVPTRFKAPQGSFGLDPGPWSETGEKARDTATRSQKNPLFFSLVAQAFPFETAPARCAFSLI
jgi:hypothetical protein